MLLLAACAALLVLAVGTRAGQMNSSQKEVGGWPELKSGPVPVDTDNDGLPDAWETAHGLNPRDAADAAKLAPSGYTQVEEYLNSLAAR